MQPARPCAPHTSQDMRNGTRRFCPRSHSYSVSSQLAHGEAPSMPEGVSESMPESMPESITESMPERMPESMSESMTERMPESTTCSTCGRPIF